MDDVRDLRQQIQTKDGTNVYSEVADNRTPES